MGRRRLTVAVLVVLAIAGCRSVPPEKRVDAGLVLPARAATITVESNQRLLLPGELGRLAMPDFPGGALLRPGEQVVVCTSFTVTADGAVTDISFPEFEGEGCAEPEASAVFRPAIEHAVASWPFVAAAICTYADAPSAMRDDAECTHAIDVAPIPVRLAWRFVFSVTPDGSTRVTRAGEV